MGKFLVIEGLDGSGKTTQTSNIVNYLKEKGNTVKEISFPSYGKKGATLVEMYLGGEFGSNPNDTNAFASSMFYAADRYSSYAMDWKKDIENPDTIVVATRYTTSNAYHQLSKLPKEEWDSFLEWLYDFEYNKLGLPSPDQVILLLANPRISLQNVDHRSSETGQKKDIHELNIDYLDKCYDAALYAANMGNWNIINCTPENEMISKEKVFEQIKLVL